MGGAKKKCHVRGYGFRYIIGLDPDFVGEKFRWQSDKRFLCNVSHLKEKTFSSLNLDMPVMQMGV